MGIYKQKDRRGRIRWVVSRYWPQRSGRLRKYEPSMTAAKALLVRIDYSIADGSWRELKRELAGEADRQLTMAQFTEEFLENYCRPRMRTWKQYQRSLRDVNKMLGLIQLNDFSRGDLHRYIEKRRKQVSAASVNRDISAVKKMFSYALDVGLLENHPLVRFKLLKEQGKAFVPLTGQQVQSLVESMPNPVIKVLVTVLAETGLRKSEALFLRWENLDFQNKVLTTDQTKNYKARQVPLSEPAVQSLIGLIRYANCPYVFVNPQTAQRWVNPEKAFERGREKAGLIQVGLHDLRRFRATQWQANGVDVRTISMLLGHSSLETTLRYLGLSRNVLDNVRDAQARETGLLQATNRQQDLAGVSEKAASC